MSHMLKPTKEVSSEDCVKIGGHCWEGTGMVYSSNPPQYPEKCKHCPASRIGTPQANMSYRYPKDQP